MSSSRTGARTEAVMKAVHAKIANKSIGPGDRLPSVRAFAETMGVSPSTVVEAYDRLAASGIITARPGSGFYATGIKMVPLSVGKMEPRRDRIVDPFWVSRQSLDADGSMEMPGCGWLPVDWMPSAALRKGLRTLARADNALLTNYGGTRGSATLRRLLLGRFVDEGVVVEANQLLLTASGTQAIDLVCRYLLNPGDVVLVDDPGYFNFQALLRAHRVKLVGIPHSYEGPDVAAFETALRDHQPRLYITNSALHNPTGTSLSPNVAHRILRAAAEHRLVIVEDDIFADFEPTRSPSLAVLDGLDRVIRIGSFSKTLSASIRCGYIAARADWIEGLIDLQVATSFNGPSPVAAELIANVLTSGGYRKHMTELRQRLAHARERTTERLARLEIQPWHMPRGGFYLWCKLPKNLDSANIARRCLESGVVLAPGNVFSVSQSASSFLRFNVAHTDTERVENVLRASIDQSR